LINKLSPEMRARNVLFKTKIRDLRITKLVQGTVKSGT